MSLKFTRILTVENKPGEPEKVPGLIGQAFVKKILLGDAKSLMGLDGLTGYSRILELSLCDAEGKALSLEEINDMPFDATKALAEIASEWNGLSGKAQKDLEKNSDPSQNGD